MSTTDAQQQAILAEVSSVIRDVIGEEWADEVRIDMDTSFADLELESIEIVALGERLQERYSAIDFAGWLASMELDEIVGLKIGRLVAYVSECL